MAEYLLASPSTTIGADASATVTMTASEDGVCRLSTLGLMAFVDTDIVIGNGDFSSWLSVSSVVVYGNYELIQGDNTPVPPSSVLNPLRKINFIGGAYGFQDLVLKTGSTVAVTVNNAHATASGNISIGAAFRPTGQTLKSYPIPPSAQGLYFGTPVAEVAGGGTTGTLTFTSSISGVASLSSLVIRGMTDVNANASYIDLVPGMGISAITLANKQGIVVGDGSLEAPGAMLSGDRANSWVDFGNYKISPQQTITIDFANNGKSGINGNFSAGMIIYPDAGAGIQQPCPAPPPCR